MSTDLSHRLRVGTVVRETHDSVSVHFTLAPNQRESFDYRPGQFLTLRLPTPDGGHVSRCYSLASAPGVDDELVVTVKRVENGPGSNWLCDLADAGESLEIESLAPSGAFVPRDLDADLLLVAGGSGITPVMSILRSALARGTGKLTVLYANRDERSVIFAKALSDLAHENPDRLVVHHWIESVQGLPTVQTMRAIAERSTFSEAFVCGPTPFMHCMRDALREAGYDRKAIHLEKFNSLSGDPFDGIEPAPEPDHEDAPTRLVDAPSPEAEVEAVEAAEAGAAETDASEPVAADPDATETSATENSPADSPARTDTAPAGGASGCAALTSCWRNCAARPRAWTSTRAARAFTR